MPLGAHHRRHRKRPRHSHPATEVALSVSEEVLSDDTAAKSADAVTQKTARSRSLSDQEALTELALIASVAHAAQRHECVAPLATEAISVAFVAQLLTNTQATQGKFAHIVTLHGNKQGASATEKSHHTELQSVFTAWKTADQEQTTHTTDASQLLVEAKAELEDLKVRRREIQLAADTIWPYNDPNKNPIRTAFSLPNTRPFRAVGG